MRRPASNENGAGQIITSSLTLKAVLGLDVERRHWDADVSGRTFGDF